VVKGLLTLPVLPLYAVEKWALNLESTFWWWISAGIAGLWWTRRRRPDLVYSTGGPMSAHAAGALIAGVRRVPWIAEIQDPLLHQGRGRGPAAECLVAWLEHLVHARATGVVYLTELACQRAKERTGGPAPCTFIYPGAECGAKRVDPGHSNRMQVAHVGTFGTTRNPKVLLEALARLASRRGDVRRDLRLCLLGSADSASRRMVRVFAYPEMIEAMDKVSRGQALQVVANSDLLLVIQNRDRVAEETIPSKTYDYLTTGRPILGLIYRNRELRELLEAAGHIVVEGDDVKGIERALEASYERWKRDEAVAEPFSRYTPARAVEQLVAWSRTLRSSRLRGRER
jgi:glycosyltransferase involved in cell wall biosynthesis